MKRQRVVEEQSFIQANLPNGREIINLTNQKTNVEKVLNCFSILYCISLPPTFLLRFFKV